MLRRLLYSQSIGLSHWFGFVHAFVSVVQFQDNFAILTQQLFNLIQDTINIYLHSSKPNLNSFLTRGCNYNSITLQNQSLVTYSNMSNQLQNNHLKEAKQKQDRKPFIEYSCLFTNCNNPEPLCDLKISDTSFLDEVATERASCSNCGKSRKYYCYSCFLPLECLKDKLPSLQLPIAIDIIKHANETEGKSTAIHAAVLAKDKVKVYIYPNVPDYTGKNVLLVFPGKNSKPLKVYYDEIVNVGEEPPKCPFERVVFIDSTWRQTKRLYGDERLNRLPCVVLNDRESLFWRHQRTKPMSYLATVEAIYYFLVEYHEIFGGQGEAYDGRYDNVLFFFKYMYNKIRKVYDPRIAQLLRERSGPSS